jgi:multimeric flavodoxin WrbA
VKVTILSGNSAPQDQGFDAYLAEAAAALRAQQHEVTLFALRDLAIRPCTGCFGCWVKTPGRCVFDDASHDVCQAVITSDFLLWAAPLRMGFPDAVLKRTLDRSIPLVHPYFELVQGEVHHRARYERYPRMGLLLQEEADTTAEEVRIVGEVFSRIALNMKSRLDFALTTASPVDQVVSRVVEPGGDGVPVTRGLRPLPGVQVDPPAELTIFNGSPRRAKSNTALMLAQVAEGFSSGGGRVSGPYYLGRGEDMDRHVEAFSAAEAVLVGCPLYVDAMPSVAKQFIEALEPLRGRKGNPALGFLMQSGFPEATHLRYAERYLEVVAARLGSPYLGTLVKGGGEMTRTRPDKANRKLYRRLHRLGRSLREEGRFDPDALRALAGRERFPRFMLPVLRKAFGSSLVAAHWDQQLKKNGVYEQRWARPFAQS